MLVVVEVDPFDSLEVLQDVHLGTWVTPCLGVIVDEPRDAQSDQ